MTARKPTTVRRSGRALVRASTAVALLLAESGCATRWHVRKEAEAVPIRGFIDPSQPRELDKAAIPPYVLEPPDELNVMVKPTPVDWPSALFVVRQDGVLDLGLYGDVVVAGLPIAEAERRIAAQLDAAAMARGERPAEPFQVAVRLNNSQSKFYYVIGTVGNEGKFPIKGSETVLDGILQAGLKSNSLPEKAYLARPRPTGGPEQILRIDWCAIKDGDTTTNYQLFPGDRIVVPGTRDRGLVGNLFGL